MQFKERRAINVADYWHKRENFSLLHTCTNLLIDTSELLHDKWCNEYIQKCYQPQDKVIVANQTLKQYLKETYPQITFVNSTTLGITNIDEVNKISENEIYVLNYNKNGDDNYLKQLKYTENIEILCGEHCVMHCKNRKQHYIEISKVQLGEPINSEAEKNCPFFKQYKEINIPVLVEQSVHRVPNWRIEQLSEMGFIYFKIAGRTLPCNAWLSALVYYLVKPQYCQVVFESLMQQYSFLSIGRRVE